MVLMPETVIFFFSYKKFVRGKDVSRYSGTDLMCILGKTETFTQKKKPIDDVE